MRPGARAPFLPYRKKCSQTDPSKDCARVPFLPYGKKCSQTDPSKDYIVLPFCRTFRNLWQQINLSKKFSKVGRAQYWVLVGTFWSFLILITLPRVFLEWSKADYSMNIKRLRARQEGPSPGKLKNGFAEMRHKTSTFKKKRSSKNLSRRYCDTAWTRPSDKIGRPWISWQLFTFLEARSENCEKESWVQGCQMVCFFEPKIPIWVNFEVPRFVKYYMAI
jgi:hypothetical protein